MIVAALAFSPILCAGVAGPAETNRDGIPNGIVWYGVLADGVAEAIETGKPILLMSAAPQCAGAPGMW